MVGVEASGKLGTSVESSPTIALQNAVVSDIINANMINLNGIRVMPFHHLAIAIQT